MNYLSLKNYIETIDRISKILGLQPIRYYTSLTEDPAITKYLISKGFSELQYAFARDLGIDYLYVGSGFCSIDSGSANIYEYERALKIFKSIPSKEHSNMSDEELDLLIRLG